MAKGKRARKLNKDEHKFNLTDMIKGDWFLGCKECWYQLSVRALSRPKCSECGNRMNIYTITEDDLING